MKPVQFEAHGPFEVSYERDGKRTTFKPSAALAASKEFTTCRGVYIFAVKRGTALLPFYVGETSRPFKDEVFEPHKVAHYHTALGNTKRWKASLFLIVQPESKKPDVKFIRDIENFLIRVAWQRNPDLCNIKGLPEPKRGNPRSHEPWHEEGFSVGTGPAEGSWDDRSTGACRPSCTQEGLTPRRTTIRHGRNYTCPSPRAGQARS